MKETSKANRVPDDFVPFFAYGASASTQELVAVHLQQADGKLVAEVAQREPLGFEAAPVLFHERHRSLYVASLQSPERGGNKLTVFSVGARGGLTRTTEVSFEHGSAYLSLDRTGKFLLSASYFEGHTDVYRIDEEGVPAELVHTQHEGRDKAHSIRTDHTNRFAYVAYVDDQNALFQYAFDDDRGKLLALDPPQAKVLAGVGPRHVAYHPSKPYVYFSNEQHLGASSYRIEDGGQATLLQVCQPGELKRTADRAASDIAITPSGRFLYVGVRDFDEGLVDAVHCYEVRDDGTLAHLGKTECDAIPWGLQMSPDGRHLLVTATEGGTLSVFEIDSAGNLHKRTSIAWGKLIRGIAVVVV